MTWLLSVAIVAAATYGLWLYARWVDDVRFAEWFGPRGTSLSWHDEEEPMSECPRCKQPLDEHDDEQARDCAYAFGYSDADYGRN